MKGTTYNDIKFGVNVHNLSFGRKKMKSKYEKDFTFKEWKFVSKKGLTEKWLHKLTEKLTMCVVTCDIHHWQGRHSPLHKHAQCFNNGCIWMNESNVAVRANAQLLQILPHEGWFRHLTHLQDHTHTHTMSVHRTLHNAGWLENTFL